MADDVIANEDEKMVAEMHMLAKLALRTDQAVYNVNTGLCIVPDVNGDGELFGAQYTHTSLDVLLSAGSNGLPESALEYTMSYYPASGTCATNRLDAIYELEEGINAYDNDLEKTNSLPQMIDMMVASGKGWCLADPYSIAAEAGIVPQRYLDVAYVPDNADPEDKPLGWMDFLEAAEGNAAYAMMLVDRAEWTYALQEGCRIADPLVTEELFKTMDAAGKFETDPEAVLSQVADMVQHDMQAMQGNAHKLDSMDLGGAAKKPVVGKCPRCGLDVHLNPKTVRCSSIKYGKDEKGNWIIKDAGCGFQFYRSIAHKTLTEPQIKKLLEDGITGTISGFKKTGGGTVSAKVTLDKQEPSLGFCFDGVTSRKGSPKRKR